MLDIVVVIIDKSVGYIICSCWQIFFYWKLKKFVWVFCWSSVFEFFFEIVLYFFCIIFWEFCINIIGLCLCKMLIMVLFVFLFFVIVLQICWWVFFLIVVDFFLFGQCIIIWQFKKLLKLKLNYVNIIFYSLFNIQGYEFWGVFIIVFKRDNF